MNDILIIGGGISGLHILDQLTSKYVDLKIKLIERGPNTGGRISTKYYQDSKVKFETGPWRFHHSHNRLIELLKKYDLSFSQNSSSHYTSYKKKISLCSNVKNKNIGINKEPGLSYKDVSIIKDNTCVTKQNESMSKIPLIMDSTSKPYDVDQSYKGKYFVVDKGFSELIKKMNDKLQSHIHTNYFVEDVIRNNDIYHVTIRRRIKNTYKREILKCKFLFVCVPPKYSMNWTIVRDNLLPLIHSVDTIPLNHIYGYSNKLHTLHDNKFYIKTDTELSQIISGDYNNNWFQASYSSGENAKFFNRLKQVKPGLFGKVIRDKLSKIGINIPITKLESFYWEDAIHYWKPAFNFDIEKSVKNSIYPHPIHLPNLFYAGESFSSVQGWIEGALETSDMTLKMFETVLDNNYIFKPIKLKKKDEYVILDGRVLDVEKWKFVHPGSTNAIKNHMYTDISKLFRHIKHTHNSWAIVYHIQKYWIHNKKIGIFEIK